MHAFFRDEKRIRSMRKQRIVGRQPVDTTEAKSSWTLSGKALPFISTAETEEEVQRFMRGEMPSMRKWYADGLAAARPDLLDKAGIPVEKIRAPLFLVSDRDDQAWPSSEFCEAIIRAAR